MLKYFVILLWALLFAGFGVNAHQQTTAISTLLFNALSNNVEVTHRFNVHDAEHEVKQIFGKQADIIKNQQTQEKFSQYVGQRFKVLDSQDLDLPLTMVGYELEGQFFWVYQETKQPIVLNNLTIRHDALRDLWPSQINTINVEGKGQLQTLTFSDSVELLTVEFGH
jgi:hypothetical protein